MNSQKLITSISTIPNQSKLFSTKVSMSNPYLNLNNSSMSYIATDLRLPAPTNTPLKFPKRFIRKQTETNMLSQTSQNPQRSSVRVYNHANKSRVFQQPDHKNYQRRLARQGQFHSLSRESFPTMPLNRSFQDLGASNNRKRFVQARNVKPDPILIGQAQNQHNSNLQKVWGQPRRHRDNGKNLQQTLQWKINKGKGYLDRYRDQQKHKISQKAFSKSIIS